MPGPARKRGRPVRRGPYPELTITAVVVGYLLGTLIALSIGYAALILGFSIEGSELAAILGFAILRGLLGRHSIVENNINQTAASAVNGASSGMMFSVPALFILGYTDFSAPLLVLGAIVGAFMGIAFIIPLRKQMIDFERLAYPGGIAVAAILKSPGAGMRKAMLMVGGAALSGVIHLTLYQIGEIHNLAIGDAIGMPEYMNGIWYASLLTVGVGFLAGKGGVFFIIGGYACYWVLAPILSGLGKVPSPEVVAAADIESSAEWLRLTLFRPLGIGMLIGGALAGIVLALPVIRSAIGSMRAAAKSGSKLSKDEMPIKLLGVGVVGAFVVLLFMAISATEHMGILRGATMALLGTLWIWVAGVILSECIGRTNWSPLSGMTLIGITILIFVASGLADAEAVVASVMVGAAMCVAMSQATDLMLDLKTGYLVGATPKKQQMAQFAAAWLGPIVIMILIFVLHEDAGLGSKELPAPQGKALASMIQGILGEDVPLPRYLAGAGLGAMLSASGIGGLGILVGLGFYLPFNIVLTYTIGTLLRLLSDWKLGKEWSEETGIPIAAGLLVGEALVGVGFAIFRVVSG